MAGISYQEFSNFVNNYRDSSTPTTAVNTPTMNSNSYTRQQILPGGYKGVDPTSTASNFFDNYRSTTKKLGSLGKLYAQTGKKVDKETQDIMDRIKLPNYNDVIPQSESERYMQMYSENPSEAERQFNEASNEWENDNFYYKLRAAQVLKTLPEKQREGILNNFKISMYDAKNELDKEINNSNQKMADTTKNILRGGADILKNALGLSTENTKIEYKNGNKYVTTTDENGRKKTTVYADVYTPNNNNSETESKEETVTESETTSNPSNTSNTDSSDTEIVSYTYKPGDTFGQVIKNLGLDTNAGLWGQNGDVAYYTKQLIDQGALDQRGNVKVGTTIKLKRRK